MKSYDIETPFNDVPVCFLITANPIVLDDDAMSEEELNRLVMEGGDISELTNKSNISPFRTILFPNDKRIANVFIKLLNDNDDREEQGKKPIFPTINLNRFEQETPVAYFRRYHTKDENGENEGNFILASEGDETLPNDPMKRKVFRTIWVTSICKTDANGVDTPTENIVRKAARAYTNGLETDTIKGKMLVPCDVQLKLEAKKASANVPKKEDVTGGDDLLVNDFEEENKTKQKRRQLL